MTRTLRLHLIITLAGFMPAMSIVWHRIDQRADASASWELKSLAKDINESPMIDPAFERQRRDRLVVELRSWLRRNAGHPVASVLNERLAIYKPSHGKNDPRTAEFDFSIIQSAVKFITQAEL
jgi:hypothetical protein